MMQPSLKDALWLKEMNKQTDPKGQQRFILFYFVHVWRTLQPF